MHNQNIPELFNLIYIVFKVDDKVWTTLTTGNQRSSLNSFSNFSISVPVCPRGLFGPSHLASFANEDVGWLHVSVEDPPLVQVRQGTSTKAAQAQLAAAEV